MALIQQDNSPDAMDEIKKISTPEFRNRLDNIIWSDHLSTTVIHQGCRQVYRRAAGPAGPERRLPEVSQEARDWLAEKGYDRAMGARPMGRVIRTT